MLRLFDSLEVDPNTLFQDSFQYNKRAYFFHLTSA